MLVRLLRQAGALFVAMPRRAKLAAALAVTLMALATAWLVYATGGVRFAYLHLMYVPVVLSALAFGVSGGVLAGIAGGVLLGPWMPQDTSTGEMQGGFNWSYRLTFFTLIGALVGVGAQHLRRHLHEMQWLHEHHADTGLLNLAGLIKQLDRLMRGATDAAPGGAVDHPAEQLSRDPEHLRHRVRHAGAGAGPRARAAHRAAGFAAGPGAAGPARLRDGERASHVADARAHRGGQQRVVRGRRAADPCRSLRRCRARAAPCAHARGAAAEGEHRHALGGIEQFGRSRATTAPTTAPAATT